ncbi:class I SAM-dependent methyltransferase [Sulfurimonas sp. NW9]|uniref:class I SAM-dependent methyltransferase n=1 Tax=Sulfurimonas sp. NW9 TaxID=2922728 RepID=UPI003DA8E8F6
MKITEKSFWEQYWGEILLPQKVNFSFKNDRVIAETILKFVPKVDNDQKALEIGCAPGKWLTLVYENLNYDIDGFEYVDVAAEKTKENFKLCHIPENRFNVITADFLTQSPDPKYDLVMSFGFIEHFENYDDIYQKHIQYCKKNGYVVTGFPNFRGINYYLQLFIDRISGSSIIKNHNIKMMDKVLMEKMIKSSKKELVYLDYIGGFEPALFNINKVENIFLRFILKVSSKALSIIFSNIKNKYISSYLIFVVKND